jgi:alpha-D-xyloside xylohydrolase
MKRRGAVLGVLLAAGATGTASAAKLESAALSLEVTEAPYAYRVLERSSGRVLLVHSATTFTAGGAATSATAVATTATTLEADLTLATGTAHVRFAFSDPEVLEVELTRTGATQIQEQFEDQQEHYYGVWEYPWGGGLDNRGAEHPFLGVGQNTGSLYTSGRAPFYVTSRGYGLYVQTAAQGRYAIASGGKTSFAFDGGRLKYHVIHGPSYDQVLARYAAIAGGPALPPLWALDAIYWSDDFHQGLHNTTTAQGNVLDLATQLAAHRLRASAILVDRPYGTGTLGWGNMDFDAQFPAPAAMAATLKDRGLHLVLWVANRAWNNLYTDGKAAGYLFSASETVGPAVDLRNQAAYDWLKLRLDPLAALARGYKIDRGEQGEHPDSVQNENVTLFARLAREGLAAHHGEDVFLLTRNVNDTGRRYTGVWNGDSRADFTGLAYSVAAGLRSGMVMMPVWGSDTGGYLRGGGGPSEEVFARWYGFSAYSPVMEVLIGDDHAPWYDYSAALVAIARKHGDTHHDLMPYVRSLLYAATKTGAPAIRPLFFSHPDDPGAINLADQYLYGSELLVAPVLQAGATSRGVYLPSGKWLDYNGRTDVLTGGATVQAASPLDTIPVYAREGAIVPRGDIYQGNDRWTAGWAPSLRIEVFPSATLPSRFDHYTGSAVQTITAVKASGRITIQFGDLGLPGKLDVYLAGLSRVVRNGVPLAANEYTYSAAARLLSVTFAGATTLEIEGAVSLFGPGNDLMPDAGPDAAPDPVDAAPLLPDAGADAPHADAAADAAVAPDLAVDRANDLRDVAWPADGARDVGAEVALVPDAGPDLATASGFDAASPVVPATGLQAMGKGCDCAVAARPPAAGLAGLVIPAILGLAARRRGRRKNRGETRTM